MASKRAEAGDRVAALAEALSDALLVEELDTKEAMEALFAGGIPVIAEKLAKPGEIVAVARRMALSTEGLYARLVTKASDLALESIGLELDACEGTLAKKYAGLADEAVVGTREFRDLLLDYSVQAYTAGALTVVPWFEKRLTSELQTSKSLKEEPDVALSRLIAPKPVPLADHSGRGLWWKVLEHCHRTTREAEIATVNAVRQRAMEQFNLLGEAR